MRSAAFLLMIAACGAKPRAPGAPGHEAGGAAAATPCPDDATLGSIAAGAWAPHERPEELWCEALRVQGEPRWWIAGYAYPKASEDGAPHYALVAPNGNVVWSLALPFDEFYPTGSDATAADLDGDRTDEVIYVEIAGEGGGSSTSLVVAGVGGGTPVFGRAELGWSAMDEGCTAEWAITDQRLVITGADDCATYSGKFRWDGSTLVTE